ncbi:Uma2 family endonuclease [Lentzea sp. NEAU-D13]|uniref:Uma2 family endonuclease n=2 Tax=Lentzea alba TaxID=2714351 RepID=A0A7C9RP52_9PSEU|nr:Uma2 family endonuclease [Lentzea alba]
MITVATGPLTVAQYIALGETEDGYTELVDGRLIMFPNSLIVHARASINLVMQLVGQLPDDLKVIPSMDVNLELAPPDKPGFVRRPDFVVIQRSALRRLDAEDGLIRATEVVLAVEVLSPVSRYTDSHTKRAEYAEAGIPFYWLVDLDEPISLTPMHLTGELGYQEAPAETGVYEAVEPFPLKIQIDRLID